MESINSSHNYFWQTKQITHLFLFMRSFRLQSSLEARLIACVEKIIYEGIEGWLYLVVKAEDLACSQLLIAHINLLNADMYHFHLAQPSP